MFSLQDVARAETAGEGGCAAARCKGSRSAISYTGSLGLHPLGLKIDSRGADEYGMI